jgi:hypothetical protein
VRNAIGIKKVVIASINGVKTFSTFKIRGFLQGKRVTMLIDGGASHNFIGVALVNRRHLPTMDFKGFLVEVAGRRTMPCDRYIPLMSLTLGRHNLTQDFYVMDIPDTNVLLGVQWLSTLGPINTNYNTMEMSFNYEEGKGVTFKGMTKNTPRVVSRKCIEVFFRNGDVAYVAECLVVTQNTQDKCQHYSLDIHRIIDKNERIFGQILPEQPPDRGFEHII